MEKYILSKIKKLTKSTNGSIYTCKVNKIDAILKVYKCKNEEIKNKIIKDINTHKKLIAKKIKIPKILDMYCKNNLIILEQYAGVNLGNYFKEDIWNKEKVQILQKCIKIISSFSEGIPIDTNPYNFTIDNKNNIYFVDFIPHNPWDFMDNFSLRNEFEKYFPSVKNAKERKINRMKRYYLNKYRIIKFLHYLDITQSTPQER